jgi:hypothetical protein
MAFESHDPHLDHIQEVVHGSLAEVLHPDKVEVEDLPLHEVVGVVREPARFQSGTESQLGTVQSLLSP